MANTTADTDAGTILNVSQELATEDAKEKEEVLSVDSEDEEDLDVYCDLQNSSIRTTILAHPSRAKTAAPSSRTTAEPTNNNGRN